jgi:hypothetical protein
MDEGAAGKVAMRAGLCDGRDPTDFSALFGDAQHIRAAFVYRCAQT